MSQIPKSNNNFTKNDFNNGNQINNRLSVQTKSKSSSSSFARFNPIIVATITLSTISWIIAFAGSIASSQTIEYFPKFTWWGLVFELIVVVVIPILYFFEVIHLYQNFLIAVLTIAFVYTSNSANNLVYYTSSSTSAAGTGFILLSIMNFLWLFYLGSDSNAFLISNINKYGGPLSSISTTRKRINSINNATYSYAPGSQSTTRLRYDNGYEYQDNNNNKYDDIYSNMEDAHELAGFENPTSSQIDTNTNSISRMGYEDSAFRISGVNPTVMHPIADPENNEGTNFTGISSATAYVEDYPILVRGLYDYIANPDDVNELSFVKGEIFRVKNTNGNWWQGKNRRGEIGMCPSNYLEIVN